MDRRSRLQPTRRLMPSPRLVLLLLAGAEHIGANPQPFNLAAGRGRRPIAGPRHRCATQTITLGVTAADFANPAAATMARTRDSPSPERSCDYERQFFASRNAPGDAAICVLGVWSHDRNDRSDWLPQWRLVSRRQSPASRWWGHRGRCSTLERFLGRACTPSISRSLRGNW